MGYIKFGFTRRTRLFFHLESSPFFLRCLVCVETKLYFVQIQVIHVTRFVGKLLVDSIKVHSHKLKKELNMPLVKPQSLKSLNTIALQPDKMSSRIEAILLLDLAGRTGNQIAEELGYTAARVSIIRNSPMYINMLEKHKGELRSAFIDKRASNLSGDPVKEALKKAALDAAKTKIDIMQNGKSEFAKLAASGDILDRAGYRAHETKTTVSVELSDKIATRFEKAMAYRPRLAEALRGGGASDFGGQPSFKDQTGDNQPTDQTNQPTGKVTVRITNES